MKQLKKKPQISSTLATSLSYNNWN